MPIPVLGHLPPHRPGSESVCVIAWLCHVNTANAAVSSPQSGNRYPVKKIPLALLLCIAENKNDSRPKRVQFRSPVYMQYKTGYRTTRPAIQSGIDPAEFLIDFVQSDDQSSPSDPDKAGSTPEKSANIVVPAILTALPNHPVPYTHLYYFIFILNHVEPPIIDQCLFDHTLCQSSHNKTALPDASSIQRLSICHNLDLRRGFGCLLVLLTLHSERCQTRINMLLQAMPKLNQLLLRLHLSNR